MKQRGIVRLSEKENEKCFQHQICSLVPIFLFLKYSARAYVSPLTIAPPAVQPGHDISPTSLERCSILSPSQARGNFISPCSLQKEVSGNVQGSRKCVMVANGQEKTGAHPDWK